MLCLQAGKVRLTLEVSDMAEGDARHCVPRCISAAGGNDDLDAINMKVCVLCLHGHVHIRRSNNIGCVHALVNSRC